MSIPRMLSLKLDFLEPGKNYKATIYKDGKNADWAKNPTDYQIEELSVNSLSGIDLSLAPGGGAAISLMEIK